MLAIEQTQSGWFDSKGINTSHHSHYHEPSSPPTPPPLQAPHQIDTIPIFLLIHSNYIYGLLYIFS